MFRFLLIFLIAAFISTSCYGCSYIQKYIPKLKESEPSEETENEREIMTDPIPINQQHS